MYLTCKKLFNFVICIIIYEKKIILKKLSYINFLVKQTNLITYLKFLFNRDKYNPIKSKIFFKYIKKNKEIFKLKETEKDTILVDNFVNHPSYTLSNAIACLYLNTIYNYKILSILRSGDIKGEILFRSFGIKNFHYIKAPNILQRAKYIFITINKFNEVKSIKKFCKIKYKKIEVGLSSYDTYIRYLRIPTLNKTNNELLVILAECLYYCDYFEKFLLKNKNIKLSIQRETVFNPLNSLFQICLKNKINIFSLTGVKNLSLRHYTKWNQRKEYTGNISQKIFDNFYKNNKKKVSKIFNNIYNNKIKNNHFGVDSRIVGLLKHKQINISKKEFINKFKLDNKKKIAVFFLNHLIDKNFHHGIKKNFKDNYSAIDFVLNLIPKLNNINWIIKLHPTEYFYKARFNLDEKIQLLKKRNIVLYPQGYKSSALLKIADIAITSHGTAGVEYPAFGIPSIFFDNSFYSKLKFMKMKNTKKDLIYALSNMHNLKKLNREYILKCRALLVIQNKLIANECGLIPNNISITRQINEDDFWKNCLYKIKDFKLEKDPFFNMLKKQIKYKLRHTINFDLFKIDQKIYCDY
jgi:hypothetical protein